MLKHHQKSFLGFGISLRVAHHICRIVLLCDVLVVGLVNIAFEVVKPQSLYCCHDHCRYLYHHYPVCGSSRFLSWSSTAFVSRTVVYVIPALIFENAIQLSLYVVWEVFAFVLFSPSDTIRRRERKGFSKEKGGVWVSILWGELDEGENGLGFGDIGYMVNAFLAQRGRGNEMLWVATLMVGFITGKEFSQDRWREGWSDQMDKSAGYPILYKASCSHRAIHWSNQWRFIIESSARQSYATVIGPSNGEKKEPRCLVSPFGAVAEG